MHRNLVPVPIPAGTQTILESSGSGRNLTNFGRNFKELLR